MIITWLFPTYFAMQSFPVWKGWGGGQWLQGNLKAAMTEGFSHLEEQ